MKFSPEKGKVLISPHKDIMVTKVLPVPDEEKNAGKNLATDIMETKNVKTKVKANYQLGTVLASFENRWKVGEVIVYKLGMGVIDFDLLKKTKLVEEYAVVGVWDDTKE